MKNIVKTAMAGMLLPWAASAQASDGSASKWQFSTILYAWVSDMEGNLNASAATQPVHVDLSYGKVLEHLKFAGFGAFQAKKDRLIFMGDLTYAHLGAKSGIDIRDTDLLDAKLDATTFTATMLGGYRVAEGKVDVDLLVGGRLVVADNDLKLSGPLRTANADVTETWADPIVATHIGIPVAEHTTISLYGDMGAGASDFTWQALAGVQQQVSSRWRLSAGWRYYSVDHDKGSFLYDVHQSGPIFGARYDF